MEASASWLSSATPADAHAIATVLVQSWRAAYRGLLPDDILAALSVADREQLWSDNLAARLPHTCTVVVAVKGAIVGFAATGPPLVPADRSDPTLGDLYALYPNPDVWRRGLGTQLHAAALDRLRSCGFTTPACGSSTPTNAPCASTTATAGPTPTQVDQGPGDTELHERRLHRLLSDGHHQPARPDQLRHRPRPQTAPRPTPVPIPRPRPGKAAESSAADRPCP